MSITHDQLIAALNKDLEWEYAAGIQYINHAAVMTGPEYESIIKELAVHSQEEMTHAMTIAEQISFLGGNPSVSVEKIETASDSITMLEQDLRGEQQAIDSYKERIWQAEQLREYGLRRILEDILMDEEEHKRDLMTVLGK
ncbi:MAG: ferritin-like domain-containing protein [Simkaniaceae bacterium]|nr:ferritin-like domain-containing protein [Simkaniaceae bacterium]